MNFGWIKKFHLGKGIRTRKKDERGKSSSKLLRLACLVSIPKHRGKKHEPEWRCFHQACSLRTSPVRPMGSDARVQALSATTSFISDGGQGDR